MRKIDSKAARAHTLPDLNNPHTVAKLNRPLSTSSPLVLDKNIAAHRSSTAGKILLFLTALGLGAAGGSAATYKVMKDRGHAPQTANSHPAEIAHAAASAPGSAKVPRAEEVVPGVENTPEGDNVDPPDTPEKLTKILADLKIKATANDFKTKDNFMKVILLENKTNEASSAKALNWIPLPQIIKDEDILIAIRLDKENYRPLLMFRGRIPISKIEDRDDPQIIYAYYHCVDSNNVQNRGAAVAVLDPAEQLKPPRGRFFTTRHQFLATKGFTLPRCGKAHVIKEDGGTE